jgi:cytochrome oxidase Cu insertion factor (SCO1/SenC/PrrC family)
VVGGTTSGRVLIRRRWYAVSIAAAAVVGVAIGVAFHSRLSGSAAADAVAVPALHGQATWAAGSRSAPAFALRDQRGRRVTLASLRGRSIALTFLDSLCKQACPIEGQMLASAIGQVGAAARPQLVVVSVDPGGDTPKSVAHAMRKWRLPAGTTWLLGTHAQLKPVWDAYQITVDPVSGDIIHSTAVYLLDQRGFERAGFLMPFVPGLVADDLRLLAAET